jgi:hypothetical protein
MIGEVTLLPYKGMGQSKQLELPNIWEVKFENHKCYCVMIIRMVSHMKKKNHLWYKAIIVFHRNNLFT